MLNKFDRNKYDTEVVAQDKQLVFIAQPVKPAKCEILSSFEDLNRKMRIGLTMHEEKILH